MTKYNTLIVELSNSQLNKLKSVIIHKMFETTLVFMSKSERQQSFNFYFAAFFCYY